MHTAVREATRSSAFALLLVFLYLISFSIPFVFAFKFVGWGSVNHETNFSEDAIFGEVTAISSAGTFLAVSGGGATNPLVGEDFVFSFWVRPSRLPQRSEKILLAGASDFSSDTKEGFILGLSRDDQKIRPIALWADGTQARWYSFSEVELYPQAWALFVLSYTESRFLGLHVATFSREGKPVINLLGGYEVPEGLVAKTAESLKIGAVGNGRFRGRVGPFAVFSAAELGDKLEDLVKELASNPVERPSSVSFSSLKLWAPSTRNDISGGGATIELVNSARHGGGSGTK
jgi:hypothetical protein